MGGGASLHLHSQHLSPPTRTSPHLSPHIPLPPHTPNPTSPPHLPPRSPLPSPAPTPFSPHKPAPTPIIPHTPHRPHHPVNRAAWRATRSWRRSSRSRVGVRRVHWVQGAQGAGWAVQSAGCRVQRMCKRGACARLGGARGARGDLSIACRKAMADVVGAGPWVWTGKRRGLPASFVALWPPPRLYPCTPKRGLCPRVDFTTSRMPAYMLAFMIACTPACTHACIRTSAGSVPTVCSPRRTRLHVAAVH